MKMKQVKRALALLLAATLMFALAACGSGGETSTDAPSAAPTGSPANSAPASGDKVTISYWTTNRHDMEYMTPLIDQFNAESDHIYIDYQVYADNYAQMLDLAFSTNSAPDVFQLGSADPLEVQVKEKHMLMGLSQFMTDEDYARFEDGAFVEGINSFDGVIYSFPYTASACRLFYNQDIFDRVGISGPPKTLDELVEYATRVTEQLSGEGIYGFAANYKSAMSSVARTIDMVNSRSGGNRGGYDYANGRYDFSTYKPVLEAFKQLFAGGIAFPGCESLDIDPLRTQFADGKIAMYMSMTHSEPGVYANQFPTDQNWNCAQMPSISGNVDGKQPLWFGGSQLAINANTPYPDEAWEVFQFLHSDEVMSGYHSAGLGTVMIPSAVEKATPPAAIANMPDLEINSDDVVYPLAPQTVVVEGKDYYTVMVECIFGMTDIDAAIEDLNTRYNAAYDKEVEKGADRIIYPNFTPLNQDTSK